MDIHSFADQPNSQKQYITNLRSYERNIPSQSLQPYLDARPVMTKYSILPIVDPRKQITTPLIQQPTYSQEQMFNPGDHGPWSGYASNINQESELRNQLYALQNCPQATYVPSSDSNMYKMNWTNNNNNNNVYQPFPGLFKDQTFVKNNPNAYPNKIGYALFNNATRQQTRDLTNQNI